MPFAMPIWIPLLSVAGIIIQAAFIIAEHREKYVGAVRLKGTASVVFFVIGALAAAGATDAVFARMVLIGLLFGVLGDILLNLRFVFPAKGQKIFLAGIAAFLVGHILYLAALLPKCRSKAVCIVIGAVLAAAILAYIFKTMEVKPAFKIFGVFYLGAVIIMTVVAIGNLIADPCTANQLYAVGAVLFTLSDIVLIFNTFSGVTRFSLRITNLSLYYLGQLLIAASLYFA